MPSATDAGAANGLEAKWAQYYADNAPPEPVMQQAPEEEPSAGTSSLTSASTPDKSGSSAQATESPLQSPAPAAENPSSTDQPADPAPSSTADLTSGSTQETGPSPADQPDSSVDSPAKTETTPAPTDDAPRLMAEGLVDDARTAYNNKDYALANDLINKAEQVYPQIAETTGAAHKAIDAALAQPKTI